MTDSGIVTKCSHCRRYQMSTKSPIENRKNLDTISSSQNNALNARYPPKCTLGDHNCAVGENFSNDSLLLANAANSLRFRIVVEWMENDQFLRGSEVPGLNLRKD
jgi:hypothetical protein